MAEGHYDQSVSNGSIPPSPGPYPNGSTASDRIASPDAHAANGYSNGATSPTASHGGMQPIQSQSQSQAQAPVIRKKLASWVGFSNLPNQVHRRAMRWVERDGMARRSRRRPFGRLSLLSSCACVLLADQF
jgi:septin 7